MKVSVITTCYNRCSTICGAIESVLAQDYDDIEYIVVDGASTDGSIDVIKGMMAEPRWKKNVYFKSSLFHSFVVTFPKFTCAPTPSEKYPFELLPVFSE